MSTYEGPQLPPVTGEYPEEGVAPERDIPAHEGFDQAWEDALKKAAAAWHVKDTPPVSIRVSVEYIARVDIENPGSIGQYKVILIPHS